jgi:glutamate-1-semialdehyde 2,1-aminomutase/spore coat polysaccharide biosynthesis protein SpsF
MLTKKKIDEQVLWDNAVRLMPRGTQTMSKCPDQFVDGVYPKFVKSGKGAYLYGLDGKKYLDYMCALGPIILGYNHRSTNKAIKNQLKNGIIFSWPTLLEQELAQLISDIIPCAEQVRFAKNGTDVNLAAVRIARSFTGKEKILKPKNGYHGWGDWHAVTINPIGVPIYMKNIIDEFEYNNLESLENLLKKGDVAGVIIEPQSFTTPQKGFLEGIRELCTQYGAVLIFDEIVSGFRWSLGGAQEYFGVTPDLCCLGKSIANGMPLSAIAGKEKYMNEMNKLFFSMTFGGETLSLAAAIATIKELQTKDYNYLWELGNMLDTGIKYAAKKYNLDVIFSGSAPRHNLTFNPETYDDADGLKYLFYQEMVKQNILFPNVIYINFSHTKKDIQKTIKAAIKSFEFVSKNINNIDSVLEGKRGAEIFRKNN